MKEKDTRNVIHTSIWREDPEDDNAYAAKAAYCHGYDVYGEMLGNARWVDMFYLLFRGEAPDPGQSQMLEGLAVALANPGPRDAAVHAAMCGGVCGSTAASSLMAALAVGAGQLGGGREVFLAMQGWATCNTDLAAWCGYLRNPKPARGSVWPAPEHAPGFEPNGVRVATPVLQTLSCLAANPSAVRLAWLQQNRISLEEAAGCPLAFSGVAAAALADLGFSPEQGEMVHLLLRLPGAAAHALEQQPLGYKKFPFGELELEQDHLEDNK